MAKTRLVLASVIVMLTIFSGKAIESPFSSITKSATEKKDTCMAECDSVKNGWDVEVRGFYFGLGGTSSGGVTSTVKEVGIMNVVGVGYTFCDRNHLSLGVGYQARFYSLKSDFQYMRDDDHVTWIDSWDDGAKSTQSSLTVHTIQFPLMYKMNVSKKFGFFLGAALDWNFYAKFDKSHKVGDTRYSENTKGLRQNKIGVDLMGGITWKRLGIYARYSPCKVFKNNFGPEMKNTWTLGLAIGF
ncbi:MAG: outer membrane beta-barrel protein [Muribaculaceae bacterium]|nr:outer membrane beta-barrel protein [Muribaculaceae bacterium]